MIWKQKVILHYNIIPWLLTFLQGTQKLPKLCDELQKIIKPWQNEEVPVIGWNEYLRRVTVKYEGMDEDTLRSVTEYLHIMGDVSN